MYKFKRKPRQKQLEAFELSKDEKVFALLMRMRCVDKDTEYLAPDGWHKISEYVGGKVAQYNLDGTAEFVEPLDYFVSDCDEFYHFYHKNGMDQMLSPGHRILATHRTGRNEQRPATHWKKNIDSSAQKSHQNDSWIETTPEKFIQNSIEGIRIPTTFNIKGTQGIELDEFRLRLQVAFHADGSYGTKDISRITPIRKGGIAIKKQRKIERLRWILEKTDIKYKEEDCRDGFKCFSFIPPMVSKSYTGDWYNCSYEQLLIIKDEIFHWDGSHTDENKGGQFFSSRKEDIDFIQYCLSATGTRCSAKWGRGARPGEGIVTATGNGRTGHMVTMFPDAKKVKSIDGKMYCFSVPSTYMIFRRNGAVFCSGNTGKSKVAIDTGCYNYTLGRINSFIVLAPKGVHAKWAKDDLPKDVPDYIEYKSAVWRSGNKKAIEECENLLAPGNHMRFLCMNIEALSMANSPAEKFLAKFLNATDAMMVIDESHTIKNPDAKRTKKVLKLGDKAVFRRILTGTPTTGSPFDLYSQFSFLDTDIFGQSYFSYKHTYAEILPDTHPTMMAIKARGARFTPTIVATDADGRPMWKNIDKLKEVIKPYSYTCRLEDCTDLPPTIYDKMPYELVPKQRKIYDELKEKAVVAFNDDSCTVLHKMTMQLRLQQILSGYLPADMDEDMLSLFDDPKDNPRIQALLTKLDTMEAENEQAVIWCRFVQDIKILEKILGDKCFTMYGATKNREEVKDRFMAKERPYLVANIAVGGTGLDYSGVYTMIYYSNDYNFGNRDQSEARPLHVGQTRSLLIIDIEAEDIDTDKKIANSRFAKRSLAQEFQVI